MKKLEMKLPVPDQVTNGKQLKNIDSKQHHEEKKEGNERGQMDQIDFPHYKRVSNFLLGSCIGEGSFAKVRVGFHCLTKEKVAVKVINKAKAREDNYVYRNLHREGKLLQMLRHPNIVQIFDILETDNNYYLITELCNGGELIDIVTEQSFLPEDIVRKYMRQLVDAVTYMQERRIVHRDLKVENLLLDSKDNIKIIDFGLSNVLPDHNSDTSRSLVTQCGSPAYAAPELLAKKNYGPKVDVWSIGVITYALLVGKLPFTVNPFSIPKLCKKMLRGEMNPIPTNISSSCRTFICKLLTPNHVTRPTIREAAKMKWLSFHSTKKLMSRTFDPMYINLLERDDNARRRHNQLSPLLSPIIDSSVVQQMSTSLKFNATEVIRNVQKNRPGSALTTYHLLIKRKISEKAAAPNSTPDCKSVSSENPENFEETNDDEAKLDSSSSSAESQASSPDNDNTLVRDSRASSTLRKTEQILPGEKDKNAADNANSAVHTSIRSSPTQEQSNVPFKKSSVPSINLQPVKFRSNRHSINDGLNLEMTRLIDHQETENETKLNPSRKYPSTGTKPNLGSIPSESAAANVNELLHKMRKAREVLLKKQQQNSERKRLSLTSYEVNPSRKPERRASGGNFDSQTTPIKRTPSPMKAVSEAKSLSQGEGKTSISSSPPSGEPASPIKCSTSHNSTTTDSVGSARLLKRPVQISGSPKIFRHTIDGVAQSERTKLKAQEVNSRQTSPGLFPRLTSKPESVRKLQSTNTGVASKNTRTNRHSFPAARSHYSGMHGPSYNSAVKAVDEKTDKAVDSKPLASTKYQSPYKQSYSTQKPNYAYHYSPHFSKSKQKPKKIISEPIAAAISYLTSTQDKTFNKEKTTSVATG